MKKYNIFEKYIHLINLKNNDIKSNNFSKIIENITEEDGEGSTIDACREQLP